MFDKEFEEKLKESMDTPRDLDFDEGAWASLEQQLEIIGAASGAPSLLGTGLKTAVWGVKSWASIAAVVVLLGTTSFFFYRWQQAEKEFQAIQENGEISELADRESRDLEKKGIEGDGNEEISRFTDEEIGDEEIRKVENEEVRKFADEEKESKRALEEIELRRHEEQGNEIVWDQETAEQLSEKGEIDGIAIETISFSSESPIMLQTPPQEIGIADRIVPDKGSTSTRRILKSFRVAITGSLSSMHADSLQPFKGKSIGLRGEYWLRGDMAIHAGVQQRNAESLFGVQDVESLRNDFRPLNTPISRNDSLLVADLNKREIIVPIGFRYVPFQNSHLKLFTGIGVTFQKEIEQKVLLTFFHKERRPPFPTPAYEYSVRREGEVGPIRLSHATVELGTRLKLTPQTEFEIAYSYQHEIIPKEGPYARKRGHNLASGLIFSF